jgi:hypothetical protein
MRHLAIVKAWSRPSVLGIAIAFSSCRPDLGDRESLVTRTRILAVRGEPAEARPGEAVTYTVLVASPEGPMTPAASWAYCATPKLLTENGAVSAACLASGVRAVTDGPSSVVLALPGDACFLFGPEVSAAELRPRDPDVTGGFYQPLRVTVLGADTAAFGLSRILCNLSGAGAAVAADFGTRYVPNKNPTLLPLEARIGSEPVPVEAIPRAARVTLRASWPPEDAESYVSLDVAEQRLRDRRESMRVSWFATTGTFATDRTGRAEEDRESFTDNDWIAPDEPGTAHFFVVLRDARGGVAFATDRFTVR